MSADDVSKLKIDEPAKEAKPAKEKKPKEDKKAKEEKKGGDTPASANSGDVTTFSAKKANFAEWYEQILIVAEIVDKRYPVKGMPVFRGYGFYMHNRIMEIIEKEWEKQDIEKSQFPLVIPQTFLEKEKDHVKGFESECFWVTKGGLNELEVKLALRPTSETAMYYMFAMWVRSFRDLPLKVHQTCNVFRHETKDTRPLIRVREIHWNEAHTCHATPAEAIENLEAAWASYNLLITDKCGAAPRRAAPLCAEPCRQPRRVRPAPPPPRLGQVRRVGAHRRHGLGHAVWPRAPDRRRALPGPEVREGLRHQVPQQGEPVRARVHDLLRHLHPRPRLVPLRARRRPRARPAPRHRPLRGGHRADRHGEEGRRDVGPRPHREGARVQEAAPGRRPARHRRRLGQEARREVLLLGDEGRAPPRRDRAPRRPERRRHRCVARHGREEDRPRRRPGGRPAGAPGRAARAPHRQVQGVPREQVQDGDDDGGAAGRRPQQRRLRPLPLLLHGSRREGGGQAGPRDLRRRGPRLPPGRGAPRGGHQVPHHRPARQVLGLRRPLVLAGTPRQR